MKTIFMMLIILWSTTVFAHDKVVLSKCNDTWTMNVISNTNVVHSCSGHILHNNILHNIKNKTKVVIYGDNNTPLIFEKNKDRWTVKTKNKLIGRGNVFDNNILKYQKNMTRVVIYTN